MKKTYITPAVVGEELLLQTVVLDGSYTSQYSDDDDEGADDGFTRRKKIWGDSSSRTSGCSNFASAKLWE